MLTLASCVLLGGPEPVMLVAWKAIEVGTNYPIPVYGGVVLLVVWCFFADRYFKQQRKKKESQKWAEKKKKQSYLMVDDDTYTTFLYNLIFLARR